MISSIALRSAMALTMCGIVAWVSPGAAWARDAGLLAPRVTMIKANGLEFPAKIWGPENGREVLLLHGFPQQASTWNDVATGLAAAGFRVVAFDQRGYASTTRPPDVRTYNFDQFVDDAIAVADACKFGRFDVVGFGMGAAEAWILAARYPARVRSIVALRFPHPAAFAKGIEDDPAQAASWRKVKEAFGKGTVEHRADKMLAHDAEGLRAFLASSGLPEPWLDRYVRRLQDPGALAGALYWEHAVDLDEFAAVPPVTVPVYYLWSQGPALTDATARATGRYVHSTYRFEELPGAGNFMLETSSARILPAILSFYQEIHR